VSFGLVSVSAGAKEVVAPPVALSTAAAPLRRMVFTVSNSPPR
jgi:hypothetical protein